jgi:hypothetical protein
MKITLRSKTSNFVLEKNGDCWEVIKNGQKFPEKLLLGFGIIEKETKMEGREFKIVSFMDINKLKNISLEEAKRFLIGKQIFHSVPARYVESKTKILPDMLRTGILNRTHLLAFGHSTKIVEVLAVED